MVCVTHTIMFTRFTYRFPPDVGETLSLLWNPCKDVTPEKCSDAGPAEVSLYQLQNQHD